MIKFVGQDPMSAAVSRQKVNLAAIQRASDQNVRGRTKRGIDLVLGGVAQLLQLIEPAAADNTDSRCVRCHSYGDLIENDDSLGSAISPWHSATARVLFRPPM